MAHSYRSLIKTSIAILMQSCSFVILASAQDLPIPPAKQNEISSQNDGLREIGRTAETAAGQVGQRQLASDAAFGMAPIDRLDSRIKNRIENRIKGRIDPYYDQKENVTRAYEVASEKIRKVTSPPR